MASCIYFCISQKEITKPTFKIPMFLKLLLACVSGIIILTGLIASIAPPNTWDSMTYHMSRVMHWIQNQSVAHYPTHIQRQLHSNPWAEFAITHLQILSGGDCLANCVQWFSMLGCILGVTLIAKKIGADLRGQIFAAALVATLPMGILQASSTQTDYVLTFWFVCFVYYSILFKDKPNWYHSIAVGATLGLAILTKAIAYIYLLPFLVWLALPTVKKLRSHFLKPALIIAIVVVVINLGHYTRNFDLYGSPLGPGQESPTGEFKYTNDVYSVSSFLSNVIRNLGLHIGTPISGVNAITEKGIYLLHRMLGVDVNDSRTTWTGTEFHVQRLSKHEDTAGNPLHLALIVISVAVFASSKQLRKSRDVVKYIVSLITAFLLFCVFLKWQPWHSRLHLPLFVMWSPVIALVVSNLEIKWFSNAILIILVVLSLPWVLQNISRPLIGKNSILNTSRCDQYFNNRTHIKESYYKSSLLINLQQCRDIGLDLGRDDWEYPIWALLRRTTNRIPRIEHINVNNGSGKISGGIFNPCAVLKTDKDEKLFVTMVDRNIVEKASWTWVGRYGDGWIGDNAKLRLENMQQENMGVLRIYIPANQEMLSFLPIDISLRGDNRILNRIIQKGNLEHEVDVSELVSNGSGNIHITVSKTWRPIDLGINEDKRSLSIRVEYEPHK